jgi:hypothetical protein
MTQALPPVTEVRQVERDRGTLQAPTKIKEVQGNTEPNWASADDSGTFLGDLHRDRLWASPGWTTMSALPPDSVLCDSGKSPQRPLVPQFPPMPNEEVSSSNCEVTAVPGERPAGWHCISNLESTQTGRQQPSPGQPLTVLHPRPYGSHRHIVNTFKVIPEVHSGHPG